MLVELKPKRSKYLIVVLVSLLGVMGCRGNNDSRDQDKPSEEDIENVLETKLPTYFTYTDVKIEGQAPDTSAGPLYGGISFSDWSFVIGRGPDEEYMRSVFSFTATANEPLFDTIKEIGTTPIIRQVTEKGASATLECAAGSRIIQNVLVTSLIDCGVLPAGEPQSHIAQDACVEGTSCEKAAENAMEAQVQQLRSRLLGVWHGRYTCVQGETGVDVSLTEMTDSGAIRGTFSFFNLPGMHNAASGEFVITGKFDSSSNSLHVDPAGWISNPANYIAAGFNASPNDEWTHLEGNINFRGCSQIVLDK